MTGFLFDCEIHGREESRAVTYSFHFFSTLIPFFFRQVFTNISFILKLSSPGHQKFTSILIALEEWSQASGEIPLSLGNDPRLKSKITQRCEEVLGVDFWNVTGLSYCDRMSSWILIYCQQCRSQFKTYFTVRAYHIGTIHNITLRKTLAVSSVVAELAINPKNRGINNRNQWISWNSAQITTSFFLRTSSSDLTALLTSFLDSSKSFSWFGHCLSSAKKSTFHLSHMRSFNERYWTIFHQSNRVSWYSMFIRES